MTPSCPNGCSRNGVCHEGVCRCYAGFLRDDCSLDVNRGVCPNRCSTRGVCADGVCVCQNGYRGIDCSAAPGQCINACLGRNSGTEKASARFS